MNSLFSSIARLFDFSPASVQDRDERYLADSADIYDLERRMRQVERGSAHGGATGPYALFIR